MGGGGSGTPEGKSDDGGGAGNSLPSGADGLLVAKKEDEQQEGTSSCCKANDFTIFATGYPFCAKNCGREVNGECRALAEDKVIFGKMAAPPNAEIREIPTCGLHRNKYLGRIQDSKCQGVERYNRGFECNFDDVDYRMFRAHMADTIIRVPRMRRNSQRRNNSGGVASGEGIENPTGPVPPFAPEDVDLDQEYWENEDLCNMQSHHGQAVMSRRRQMGAQTDCSLDTDKFGHSEEG